MPCRFPCCAALVIGLLAALLPPSSGAQDRPALTWGGDAEGGAPFVEADPADPTRVVGFDVEVAALIAAGLGRTPRFLQVGFTSLDAAAARGDFDIALSGIEDSPARRASGISSSSAISIDAGTVKLEARPATSAPLSFAALLPGNRTWKR